MLYNGEELGTGEGPETELAVDPIEGTRLVAHGRPGAISVIAAAEKGGAVQPRPRFLRGQAGSGPRGPRGH